MQCRRLCSYLAPLALLTLSGCGYVHVGRMPDPVTKVVGDEKLMQENADLRTEKKILQQELALTRAQGDALRSAIENRAADGDTSRRLTDKLSETTRELSILRANYAQLQNQRASGSPSEVADLQAKLLGAEDKLASSLRNYTQLQEEIGSLRSEVARTRSENVALTEQVKVVTSKNAEVQLALAQVNAELLVQKETRTRVEQDATTLRTQLDGANTRLSALAQQRTTTAGDAKGLAPSDDPAELRGQLEALRQKVSALEAERTTLQQQLSSKGSAADTKALADSQQQLITALNSAKMLRDENDHLKTDKTQLESDLSKARAGGANESLRDQLAQVQAKAAALAEENTQLKARLASAAPTPAPSVASTGTGSGAPRTSVVSAAPATTSTTPPPVSPPSSRPGGSPVTATFTISSPGAGGSPTTPSTPTVTSTTRSGSAAGARYHTVAVGDTLSKISAQYYGTPGRWAEILVANREVLGEDNNLVIGRQLRIP